MSIFKLGEKSKVELLDQNKKILFSVSGEKIELQLKTLFQKEAQ